MNAPDPLLKVEETRVAFGGVVGLNGVSLTVAAGEIVGLIGPNGAGKTSLFNAITGAYQLSGGVISLAGRRIDGLKPHRIVRLGISRTFQNIRLFRSMTVWEHLLVGADKGFPANLLPDRSSGRLIHAADLLQRFGLSAHRDVQANSLPYGLQRRVEMARALMARPSLLLLDEPAAGMNADETEDLMGLLRDLGRDGGPAMLVVEHDMTFIMRLCHRIYVLDVGEVIAEGTPDEVRSNRLVLDAYLGAEA